ncbi:hypothetical protein HanRHA438_Chr16g0743551 [Helianthus annuus]|nr:hypothetical protein HanPSC8_Chr16g0701111 [Helianthus annuus]KAJ0834431.1 hypothetical protein HanRHA438_Chr16g0743551 [Helianthus annuus]
MVADDRRRLWLRRQQWWTVTVGSGHVSVSISSSGQTCFDVGLFPTVVSMLMTTMVLC